MVLCQCWLGERKGIWPVETCTTYPRRLSFRVSGGTRAMPLEYHVVKLALVGDGGIYHCSVSHIGDYLSENHVEAVDSFRGK